MLPEAGSAPQSAALPKSWLRIALLGAGGVGVIFALILFAYELARARIPQHRAALEHIVRAQTGLDIRFTELGLRWGWYGPEAVFRQVELDEPDTAEALLRAPELVVGFDAWRTLRSGHPEAGRIELVAPEIDLSSARERRGVGAALTPGATAGCRPVVGPGAASGAGGASRAGAASGVAPGGGAAAAAGAALVSGCDDALVSSGAAAGSSSVLGRVAVLQGWRGGRIDIEGGTLRLPDRGGNSNLLNVQIHRASLRRSDDEWSVAGLVYLPDRVGRSARVTLRLNGDLGQPERLAGALHIEAKRLLFPGCRDFLAGLPDLARYLPRGGNGDVTLDVNFAQGKVVKTNGNARVAGLVFDAGSGAHKWLAVGRLRGDWHASRLGTGWRIHLGALDFAQFGVAGTQLDGTARDATVEWTPDRPEGERLQALARLEDVTLVPQSKDFTLSGLGARITGNESQLDIDVQSRTARLELGQSQQQPLADVHVASTLHVSNGQDGWRVATDEFVLEHQRATLRLSGVLQDDPVEPRIVASGSLEGADIPLVTRLLGENTAQAFGAAASRLTAGRIQNAQFTLAGPISKLPFDAGADGFSGSLTLRDAVLSGGDLWPDAEGVGAHVEWRAARIQATIEAGHAGAFQLASAKAQWSADGAGATRLTGHVNGRLEDAIAWIRDHPELQEYAPQVGDIDARGEAAFDFNVQVPAGDVQVRAGVDSGSAQSSAVARVSTFVNGVSVQAVSGLPPLEGVTGSFVFDAGRLQKSTLTGSWLGGPVALRVGERREKGAHVLAIQAQGTLKAQHLAALANATGTAEGDTDWTGELAYVQAGESSRWRMRVDSNLLGVVSSLPEPLAKRPASVVPVHLEVTGTGDVAQARANLGDRLRSLFALKRKPDVGWVVDRGAVRFGTSIPVLPSESVVLVRGRVGKLDLPAYAVAWERLRRDALPTIRAQMTADELFVAGRRYGEASLRAERTDAGTDLLIDSATVAGMARWPTSDGQAREVHLTRLDLPDEVPPEAGLGLVAALSPAASVSVDELNWRGRSLGRLTGNVTAEGNLVVVDNVRLVNGTQDAHGTLRCQTAMPACRLSFVVDSTDATATLEDFGFRPELAASTASLKGDMEWRPAPDEGWLDSLHGTLSMRLADGALRRWEAKGDEAALVRSAGEGGAASASEGGERGPGSVEGGRRASADAGGHALGPSDGGRLAGAGVGSHGPGSADGGRPAGDAAVRALSPFGLLAVPALVTGLDARGTSVASLTKEQRDLHFARLEADFQVKDGQASTSNLHFDGDAEILMRGRTGLVSRDYDQQVWVLRGEDRLPAAVRRFGATPRVAAAWLSLRDLFAGSGTQDRSGAVLRLQGSWDDPMVVAEN